MVGGLVEKVEGVWRVFGTAGKGILPYEGQGDSTWVG